MQISSSARSPKLFQSIKNEGQSTPKEPEDNDRFILSDPKTKLTLGIVVGAGAGIAGFVFGNNGGWSGAVAGLPGMALTTGIGATLGAISDGANGSSKNGDFIKGALLGAGVGSIFVGAGAVGGILGGAINSAAYALLGATMIGNLLPD